MVRERRAGQSARPCGRWWILNRTRRPACRITRGGGERKDHHQRRYFHVGIGRGRPSGGGRSRCVTHSPCHARCHFLTPIDSRAHETRGIAPRADGVFAKANAVALVSAPFLPEPGSQARVVDGGQVLHVSRLGEPRYALRLADCARTPQGARQYLSWLADASTDTDPLDSAADRDWAVPDYTPTCRLPSSANRRPSTTRSPPSTTSTLVAGSGRPRRRGSRSPPPLPARSANACTTCEQSRLSPAPRPGPRAGPVLRRRPDRRDRRDRPRRRAPGASRPRQRAAARRATPATTRSASTRRGSARGRRRSRSRGARSSSSP